MTSSALVVPARGRKWPFCFIGKMSTSCPLCGSTSALMSSQLAFLKMTRSAHFASTNSANEQAYTKAGCKFCQIWNRKDAKPPVARGQPTAKWRKSSDVYLVGCCFVSGSLIGSRTWPSRTLEVTCRSSFCFEAVMERCRIIWFSIFNSFL